MQKSIINPWQWQNQLGYAQAVEVPQATHTLSCAGQAAMDASGRPITADMSGQIRSCFDNIVFFPATTAPNPWERMIKSGQNRPMGDVQWSEYSFRGPLGRIFCRQPDTRRALATGRWSSSRKRCGKASSKF